MKYEGEVYERTHQNKALSTEKLKKKNRDWV